MTDPDPELLAANDAFYTAFATGDAAAMEELWAKSVAVTCDHPGAPTLRGRDAVLASWRRILEAGGAPGIHAADAHTEVDGDMATVRCSERIEDAAISALNSFVREDGTWRMTGHRADPETTPGAA